MLTAAQLAAACGCPLSRAERWVAPLSEAARAWGVDSPRRLAAWLAQLAHESGRLVYVRELWGPTPAQRRYEGRADLGNTQPGDGSRYRGRGLIQVTGRANYAGCRDVLRATLPALVVPDFEAEPQALELPAWAAHSAGWFWRSRSLSTLADIGTEAAFVTLTRRINGGTNGLADRLVLWAGARRALGVAAC